MGYFQYQDDVLETENVGSDQEDDSRIAGQQGQNKVRKTFT